MGGSKDSPPATIANPRHAALALALSQAQSTKPSVDSRLQGVVSAMKGNAWTGGTSDAFSADLAGNVKSLSSATQACVDEIQTALSNTPATIPNPAAKPSK